MLLLQVKASKKGGIVVVSSRGEMHPCLVPEDLWDVMVELDADQPQGISTPVPEALIIQVKVRRNTVMVIDPLAEIHPCNDAHELWETLADLIESDEMPQAMTTALATTAGVGLVPHQDVQVIRDESDESDESDEDPGRMHPDDVRDVIEEMVGDSAAKLGGALFGRLRSMSHRGPAPKPGSRVPRRRVKRGDII